ncbi:MAG: hypothetical protein AAF351_06895 [Pseudomonadota bacterium]
MPTDLALETKKILALRGAKRSEETTRLVENALQSKWEGIQSAGLRVLGAWNDAEAKARIRKFLNECFAREYGWSIRGVAVEELSHCVNADDSDWILDLYFSQLTRLEKHELLPMVLALPPASARERLTDESSSENSSNRQAAMKAIANLHFDDKAALLRVFLDDPDPDIRKGAEWNIKRLAVAGSDNWRGAI